MFWVQVHVRARWSLQNVEIVAQNPALTEFQNRPRIAAFVRSPTKGKTLLNEGINILDSATALKRLAGLENEK